MKKVPKECVGMDDRSIYGEDFRTQPWMKNSELLLISSTVCYNV